MAECVFCAIVAGAVPAFRVADGPDGVAFLDARPVFKGHVLVVPRPHVADLPTLQLLDSKARQYQALGSASSPPLVPLPACEVVKTATDFEAACQRLRTRQLRPCYKPAVSIFGIGFHLLDDTEEGRRRWQTGDPVLIPTAEACQALAACGRSGALGGALRAASLSTLLNMVAAGYGTTLIPGLAAGAAQDAGIVLRPLATRTARTVRIAWRSTFPRRAAVEAVGEVIAARLQGYAKGAAAGRV